MVRFCLFPLAICIDACFLLMLADLEIGHAILCCWNEQLLILLLLFLFRKGCRYDILA